MRRVMRWLSLAALVLVILAGCAAQKNPAPGISGNPLPSTTSTTAAASSPAPSSSSAPTASSSPAPSSSSASLSSSSGGG